jgi:crotonobetainyl-CoA:carnitine CoA-transferase CaiB-like acyl-CoA transferase
MSQPILHNVRILDFTWVMAGPYATRLLADFGAEVIKVTPLLPQEEDNAFTRGYYRTWNRNKRSITLNLGKPEGVALAKKLVTACDAVIENFTPRVMANFGLDYDNLKKIKPDIIMVSMSVYGPEHPENYYTGYAPTVHALSGLTGSMALDGQPLGPGFSWSDHIAGLYASMSLLEALEYRRQTGEGRHIVLSETGLIEGLLEDKDTPPQLENVYLCKDGKWCAVTIDQEGGWEGLKRTVGNLPADSPGRDKALGDWAAGYNAGDVMSMLQQHGIACGIVQDAGDMVQDLQLKARGFFVKDEDTPLVDASPIKLEQGGVDYSRAAPPPGQDNDYVYGELLGFNKKEIAALQKHGVI